MTWETALIRANRVVSGGFQGAPPNPTLKPLWTAMDIPASEDVNPMFQSLSPNGIAWCLCQFIMSPARSPGHGHLAASTMTC